MIRIKNRYAEVKTLLPLVAVHWPFAYEKQCHLSDRCFVAAHHHEKWDGTGYPLGLAGEAIPIEGRIVAIADVLDAISSRRPYKDAFPLDRCLELLEKGRGQQFDPRVLDAFFARTEEIAQVETELVDA